MLFLSNYVLTLLPGKVSTGVAGELAITSISALDDTNTYLQINFSKAVTTGLAPSNISIKNTKTAETYGVKTVTLAADGLSAQVELFSNPNANATDTTLAYLTDYTVTVQANGTTLTSVFNRAYSFEARVTAINPTDNEITVVSNDKNDTEKTLKVQDANFDYQGAMGTLMQVWYNTDNELIKSSINTDNTKYDAIEITKVGEIKTLTDDKKTDISTETYVAGGTKKFKFYLNGVEESTTDLTDYVDAKYNYAKIGYDKSGKIEYVSAYNLAQFVIVDKVDGNEVVGIEGNPTGGSWDAEDATIVKDGKLIGLAGLKHGDVLFYHIDNTKKLRFGEVYSNAVTGPIDSVYDASISVKDNTYDYYYGTGSTYDLNNFNLSYADSAVYIDSDGKVKKVDSDAADTLQAAGDVTLNFDRAGHLVYIAGATADVATNNQSAILTDKLQFDSTFSVDKLQLSAVLASGDEKVYDLTLKDLDKITVDGVDYKIDNAPGTDTAKFKPEADATNLYLTPGIASGSTATAIPYALANIGSEGMLVKLHLKDDGTVKQVEFFTKAGDVPAGADQGYGATTTATLKSGDSYIGGKKLLSSTVVFDANKGYSNDAGYALGDIKPGDVTVSTWDAYKGTDISSSKYIYNSDNEVIALEIVATTTSDINYEEFIATNVLRDSDHNVVSVTGYVNGVLKTYTVDTVSASSTFTKGSPAVLEIDKNNSTLVTAIDLAGDHDQYDNRVTTNAAITSVDVGARKVTLTLASGSSVVYTLADNGAVLDGTDPTDIALKTLADLRGKTNVTVILDDDDTVNPLHSGSFAKYFMYK